VALVYNPPSIYPPLPAVLQIPPERLDPQTLSSVIEAFVMREGTDYGDQELSLARKVANLHRQVLRGEVLITYDPESESCNLMAAEEFRRLQRDCL